ncbi:MAG TPA: hypothetical protein VF777_09750 [Phycisphaerales bacterium]
MMVVRLLVLAIAVVAAACVLHFWNAWVDWLLDDEQLDGVAVRPMT